MATTVEDLPRTTTDHGTLDDMRREESRELAREEFFRTYDLMTGVRIAATLGGFFGMMVLLVLYKSRCRPRRAAIKEVRLAAAQAVVEEEDQQEAVAAAIYMQTVVTGRVPRRSLGALSAPVGPVGMGPLGLLGPRGSLAVGGSAGGAVDAGAWAGGGLLPRAAFGDHGPGRPEDADDRPLPIRFSSLGGCSLLEAKVAISAVRRASMLPNPPTRHLHERLHLHQQHHQQRHLAPRRESRQLQRLEDALGTAATTATSEPPLSAAAVKAAVKARRHSHCPRPSGVAAVAAVPGAHKRPKPYALRSPLGVIDSSPEVGSPAGSMGSELGALAAVLNQAPCRAQAARAPRLGAQGRSQSLTPRLTTPCRSPAHRGQAAALSLSPAHRQHSDAGDVSAHSNSSTCRALPYGAACESFELAEVAYGEACAPLARIATLETASLKDGEFADSGSDSAFGAQPTQHGQAADTAADTGVDTGQDADTDQDADGQLSTDSAGSGSSTPHPSGCSHKQRLYVLPVGVGVGGSSGPDMVTLHAAPNQNRAQPTWVRPRLRPRLARTSKVGASQDSAASDDCDCITTTPEQSQEDGEQEGRAEVVVDPLALEAQVREHVHGEALERRRF